MNRKRAERGGVCLFQFLFRIWYLCWNLTNPGRVKALEAALAVHGIAVFPNSSVEQREKGMADFNDLALEKRARSSA